MDRNIGAILDEKQATRSLSARRAWIEIDGTRTARCVWTVALRKESVDRNFTPIPRLKIGPKSLSARRAWIEIQGWQSVESVPVGRSPQGERG